jgi:hypothetical protein
VGAPRDGAAGHWAVPVIVDLAAAIYARPGELADVLDVRDSERAALPEEHSYVALREAAQQRLGGSPRYVPVRSPSWPTGPHARISRRC